MWRDKRKKTEQCVRARNNNAQARDCDFLSSALFAALKLLMTIMTCDNRSATATGTRRKREGELERTSASSDEEGEREDRHREKTRSRRRHYPCWVAGRRDAAISTYRPPPFSLRFLFSFPPCRLSFSVPEYIPPLEHKKPLLGCFCCQPFSDFSHLTAYSFSTPELPRAFARYKRNSTTQKLLMHNSVTDNDRPWMSSLMILDMLVRVLIMNYESLRK